MIEAFRQGLRDLGYVEGETIAFDVRFAGGRPFSVTSSPEPRVWAQGFRCAVFLRESRIAS
jgi:hypothetical protein